MKNLKMNVNYMLLYFLPEESTYFLPLSHWKEKRPEGKAVQNKGRIR